MALALRRTRDHLIARAETPRCAAPLGALLGALALTAVLAVASSVRAAPPGPISRDGEDALARGREARQRGDVEEAALSFAQAARHFSVTSDPRREAEALLRLGAAEQELGAHSAATRSLERAARLAEASQSEGLLASALAALGGSYVALARSAEAEAGLERALDLARESGSPELTATVLNELANLRLSQGHLAAARSAWAEAAALAEQASRPLLAARALANAAHASAESGDAREAQALAKQAEERARGLPASHDQIFLLLNLACTDQRLATRIPEESAGLRLRAHALLRSAGTSAAGIGDPRAESYALGYLGGLYEAARRPEEALELTIQALRRAQQEQAPELLQLWSRQAGRLLARQGQREEAIVHYRRAVEALEELRRSDGTWAAGADFEETVGSTYLELVDLLLRQAADPSDAARAQAPLSEARDTLELLKAAELRDYLQDDCVEALRARARSVEEVSASALVVYPILLADRVELLVSLPGGAMLRRSSARPGREVEGEVRALRAFLEKRTTGQYLPHARTLYDWLIRPLEPVLDEVAPDTLVFVPGGLLRTIPMAALHDGERFLVERYAVATTPGVSLTDPRPLDRTRLRLLLGGLSASVGGRPPLEHVRGELEAIRSLYGGTLLLDRDFRLAALRKQLEEREFSVLHVATHAEFKGEAGQSYLLAYDGLLTLDALRDYVGLFRYRETPLELLTLSACETAAGDERAALGLSGIAVQAGARSALGTLWNVNDVAAAELVTEFYTRLRDPSVSRARALQAAQRALLAEPRHAHPGYWSAFLLISNWL